MLGDLDDDHDGQQGDRDVGDHRGDGLTVLSRTRSPLVFLEALPSGALIRPAAL